jgi:hypothetical protein
MVELIEAMVFTRANGGPAICGGQARSLVRHADEGSK